MAAPRHGISTARGRAKPKSTPAPEASKLDWVTLASAKAKGKRPAFLTNGDIERVLNITMAVAMEVSTLRERLDTIERLLEKKKVLRRKDIESYVPSIDVGYERGAATRAYIGRILRIVQQEREALSDASLDVDVEGVANELAKP
jgi:hypothetical protein